MVDRPHPANLSWWKRLRTFRLRPHQERNRQTADREAVLPHRSFRRWCERLFDARRPCIESRDRAVKRTVHPSQRRTVASIDCQFGTTPHSLLRTMDCFSCRSNGGALVVTIYGLSLIAGGALPPQPYTNVGLSKCQAMAWLCLGGNAFRRDSFELTLFLLNACRCLLACKIALLRPTICREV